MTQSNEELKSLLELAEGKLADLMAENQTLNQTLLDMMEANKAEAAQMVELTEQVWALEEALASSEAGKEEALSRLRALRNGMTDIQSQMKDTLEAAEKNASGLEIAARVYEMASKTDDLDKRMAEFNADLMRKASRGA